MEIKLAGPPPPPARARRASPLSKGLMQDVLADLLRHGHIRASSSPFAAPAARPLCCKTRRRPSILRRLPSQRAEEEDDDLYGLVDSDDDGGMVVVDGIWLGVEKDGRGPCAVIMLTNTRHIIRTIDFSVDEAPVLERVRGGPAIKRREIGFQLSKLQHRFVSVAQNARTSDAPDPLVGQLGGAVQLGRAQV
ncbi:hypothetical protein RI054_01g01290 [Pseudoscourfieldia marina]